MAFDQTTRNRLQRFVTDARRRLEEEFTRQLQNDYGLDPVSGRASPLESLRHINDQQRETARILRDTLAHYCANSDTDTKAGLDRIVREQAFTILNRLAALRMAEARGLLIESVGNGYQAKGFQLYARLAGTALGETGDAYGVYLQSVFDEFSLDLPGLFDRFSPQGRLFPREAVLLQVLALINHGEIEPLWAEDETIGWIYQYFNSKEERKAMRDASQAPRNSRELAVRNQFFTPRYVVEFLVDNTLGRLWFNWTGGQTALRDSCQYLLVKPDERPEPAKCLRDPRTIKLLDPACGSMHFGLYAFDLFQEIYREAWDWERTNGPGALDSETGGSSDLKPLSQTYADQNAFLRDVPRLIIECNIFGVDIDPRAAQIASLALWLRAQRAWHEAGVKAKERPRVGQGHVVAAVAPPAEVDLRKRFMEELDPQDAQLFEQTLFMLKGLPELGVLLQVEKELPALIRKVFGEHGPMFSKEDMAQWQKAETRLRAGLRDYARAARSTYQGRLFAEDALQGLRMIDHCREVFDVVVMNPPFGGLGQNVKDYLVKSFPNSKNDLLAIFVERSLQMLRPNSMVGAITSRTCFFLKRFTNWREKVILGSATPVVFSDLGIGVMDDAAVEAAAYVLEKS
ncbi:Eco57I restriction-modification methylase domain-containing protein [Rhizobium leguminosarum]|uniref:Eco57I restriction-modification methylase domain-containing protein n=1 Tax=Rhizobium leguminosarum TaxID=384 RepID=UPI0014412F48|nr:SAM-dependent methyltransferase [Rhizobium leguminosarum]NKL94168.1 SAM-dependent methyltransferase [Rhizobium leguminosarum bv. viciae]